MGSTGRGGGGDLPPPRTLQEEGVVLVPRRVLLGLEEGVEVPEGALHKIVGGHLREPVGEPRHHREGGAVLS